jgi:outer membrane lipoprotein-sorting protein
MKPTAIITSLAIALTGAMSIAVAPSHTQEAAAYKTRYQKVLDILNDRTKCQQNKRRKYKGLSYELCVLKGNKAIVSMEGPPGDAGPMLYWEGGKPKIVADTTHTSIWFIDNGDLTAEVIYSPPNDKLKTSFTAKERKEMLDRTTFLSKLMQKATGYQATTTK